MLSRHLLLAGSMPLILFDSRMFLRVVGLRSDMVPLRHRP
jgi:hypothetical protein